MFIKGKYNDARVYTDNVDATTYSQIVDLCDQKWVKGSQISIMPDCHAGAGCVIGTTMTITNKVSPNIVGVDIGCSILVEKLGKVDINLKNLDKIIRDNVPSGFSIHSKAKKVDDYFSSKLSRIMADVSMDRALKSIGTLGGGNHFIEIDVDDEGNKYLLIHTGSRNLGKQVAEYWQENAYNTLKDNYDYRVSNTINTYKRIGLEYMIEEELESLEKPPQKSMAYLQGDSFNNYIFDMKIAQEYADRNRAEISKAILNELGITPIDRFTTVHNYIETEANEYGEYMLRKGAVSAKKGERLIIPMNMRDGSLLCTGIGLKSSNFSAPHGAGRLMSRHQAKNEITLEEFSESMKGIYTTSVNRSTIDESPMAYKPMDELLKNLRNLVIVEKTIKPIYNYKDSGD